jgi:excisionase family DNA binding protein
MLGQPEQLSLPLFESDPDEGRPQSPRVENTKRRQRRRVIAGRSETPPADVSANDKPPATSAAPALLTTQEAADLLHVHPRTVQRLVERGELEVVHLGAAARFDPADVADLTSRLKQRAAAKASSYVGVVRPSRAVRVSFADRLRLQQHEHRADQA